MRALFAVDAATPRRPALPCLARLAALALALLLFAAAPAAAAPSDPTLVFQPFGDSRATTLARLDRATRRVWVAQYNIRDEAFVERLLALKARGVDVRIVIDAKNAANPWNTLDDTMVQRGLNVHRKSHSSRYGIMHHKFTIIDDSTVITGSFNWNETARLSNNENLIVIDSAELVRDYEQEFLELTGARPEQRGSVAGLGTSSRYHVLFSPEDRVDRRLKQLIDNARSSIRIAVFSFRDRVIADALAAASRRGVTVELVTEEKQAAYTDADERVASAGARVVVGANRSSTYAAMHHKYAVIDDEVVVTGACNWSYTAFFKSNEDMLFIRDAGVAARYRKDFQSLLLRYDSGFSEAEVTTARSHGSLNVVCEADQTKWGQSLVLVGDRPELGAWDPRRGVRLETADGIFPQWNGHVRLPAGVPIEYKFVILDAAGRVVWESGANHRLTTSRKGLDLTRLHKYREAPAAPAPGAR